MRKPPLPPASALLVAILTLVAVVPTWAEETTAVSESDLTYFYKAPSTERAARLVTYFAVGA
jgi:hypothetical protein